MRRLLPFLLILMMVSLSFGFQAEISLEDPLETESYIIQINDSTYQEEQLEDLGVEIEYSYDIIDGLSIEIPEQMVSEVEELGFVTDMQEDHETFLPVMEGEEDDVSREGFEQDTEKVIAILDTGIDDEHVDLQNQVVDHRDFTGDGVEDVEGHGTHVAGIAAGTGEGDSRFTGVSPESELMNVKVLRDDGQGMMSDAIRGIGYSVENNADIIVLSLGAEADCGGRDPMTRAVGNAVEEGVPVVVAAGNLGPDRSTVANPGCSPDALTVGASSNGDVASFSSRGPTSDNRVKPDLVAPGVNIVSANAGSNSGYIYKSGTSMAAPYIGGGIAVMMENYDRDPQEYYTALTETSYSLELDENIQGSGRVNLSAAIDYLEDKEDSSNSGMDEQIPPRPGGTVESQSEDIDRSLKGDLTRIYERIKSFFNNIF